MSKAISRERIVEACLDGIEESSKLYREWSGDEWLWNAPEYLITVKIADQISTIEGNKFITLEDNVDYILSEAKAKGRGRISEDIRANGRSDIVLWYANGFPRAIIEVKNSVYGIGKIEKDIVRIQDILNRKKNKSKIEFGIVTFYIDRGYKKGKAKSKVIKKIESIYKDIDSDMCDLYYRVHSENDDLDAWGSVCILFKT